MNTVEILGFFLQKPRNTEQNAKCPVLRSEYWANHENPGNTGKTQ